MSIQLSHGWVHTIPLKRSDGHKYDLLNLRPEDFPIEILASNLSMLSRFGGNSRHPYSIALHSVLVSLLLPETESYAGLMHDTTEGTGLGDVVKPLKNVLPDYVKIESHVRSQLAAFYEFPVTDSPAVKLADRRALELEDYFLRGIPCEISDQEYFFAAPLLSTEIHWTGARDMFLSQYRYFLALRGYN